MDHSLKDNTAKKFLSKIVGFSLATWISAVISLLATPVITRLFLPEELGKINVFQTFLTFFLYIGILGLNQGYIRFYNDISFKNNRKSLFTISIAASIGFSVMLGFVIIIFGEKISFFISGEVNYIIPLCLAIALIFVVFLNFSKNVYRMEKNITMYSLQVIIMSLIAKLSFVLTAFWNPSHLNGIILITVGYSIVGTIFIMIQFRNNITIKVNSSKKDISNLFIFSLPLIPVVLLSWLNTSIPILLLSNYVNYSSIGIYTSAITIVSIITLVQSGFNIFWAPFVYENYIREKNKIKLVHRLITFVMVTFGIFIVLGQDVLYILIGPEFRDSKEFFALLLVSPICYTIAETTGLGINIAKKSYLNLITTGISAFINFVICLLTLPVFGMIGAAVAVATSAFVMLIVKTLMGERYYSVIVNYKKTFSAPILFVFVAVISYQFFEFVLLKNILIIICLATLLWIYKKETLYLLKLLRNILNKKKK